MKIRNMSIQEYKHMFNAGYIKDGFVDDLREILNCIGDIDDNDSHTFTELITEYDILENKNIELRIEIKNLSDRISSLIKGE